MMFPEKYVRVFPETRTRICGKHVRVLGNR